MRAAPLQSQNDGRRGQTLGSVLLLVSFLAVLAYSLHSTMLNFRVQKHRLNLQSGVESLTLSGLAAAAVQLEQRSRSDSGFRAQLLAGLPAGSSITLDLQREVDLLAEAYPGATLDVQVQAGSARGLAGEVSGDTQQQQRLRAGRGYDPSEHRLPVRLSAVARWGAASHELAVQRELTVVNLSPGTLGKFTLWARQLTPDGGGAFLGAIDGTPLSESNPLPLVLHNDGSVPSFSGNVPDAYRRRGYVFLGGDPNLRVGAGYLGYGELWTFLPLESLSDLAGQAASGSGVTPAPAFTDSDPTDYFLRDYPPPPSSSLSGPYRFELRHMVTGFWSGQDAQGRRLSAVYPAAAAAAGELESFASSSLLRLFGTAEIPSPTLVLGNVMRSYPEVSGVMVDANSDGVVDGLVALMPELAGEFPAALPPIASSIQGLSTPGALGSPIPLDNQGETTWENMFDESTYPTFTSQLQNRPYMDAYNFLYRTDTGEQSFYPPSPLFEDFVETFDLQPGGRPLYYEGTARDLTADDLVEKAAYRVPTGAELQDAFLWRASPTARGELSLGAAVLVERAPEGALRLSNLTVTRGGWLILAGAGDIVLDRVSFAEGLDFPLVLVAMNGNVRLEGNANGPNPLPLAVLAPRGRLLADPTRPLELEGNLVVDTLDLTQFRSGGNLYYHRGLDPIDDAYADHYRIVLSDAALAW